MCQICIDWENNEMSSKEAFILIGDSLKLLKKKSQEKERDHLLDLCDKIVISLEKFDKYNN